jgi:hypothetical protein
MRTVTNHEGRDDLTEVAILGDGKDGVCFGEQALLNSKPRAATI